jgi:alanine racemase
LKFATAIRPTVARIDLARLARNFRLMRELITPSAQSTSRRAGLVAVIKANAYGHGAVPVARVLEGLGIWGFGVATVEEGVQLRKAGIRSAILVMGAAFGHRHEAVLLHRLTPVVGDPGDVDHFASAAKKLDLLPFRIHVKVDTGMTRLGVTEREFDVFLERCARYPFLRVEGLATHLSCAEEADPEPSQTQLDRFEKCLSRARKLGADPQLVHAANSAAALRFARARFDLIRPGIVLYGCMPSPHVPNPGFEQVMSVSTRINAIRDVAAGTTVSYGATFVAARDSRIATLPVGYADGYPRAVSNKAEVCLNGRRVKQVGRVCMDLCMIDVTDVPHAKVGDEVYLLGGGTEGGTARGIGADELATWADTISYEVLCGISNRVPREYPESAASEMALRPPKQRAGGAA